jgi:hypothetical protein
MTAGKVYTKELVYLTYTKIEKMQEKLMKIEDRVSWISNYNIGEDIKYSSVINTWCVESLKHIVEIRNCLNNLPMSGGRKWKEAHKERERND